MNDKGCYLLRTREFKNSNENIYKIGRSANLNNRIKNYPNNSEIILKINIENEIETEKLIMVIFKKIFIQRKDIGYEYFEGNIKDIKNKFKNIIIFSNIIKDLNLKYDDIILNLNINSSIKNNKTILEEIKNNINKNKEILKEIKNNINKNKEINNKVNKTINKSKKLIVKIENVPIKEEAMKKKILNWFEETYEFTEEKSGIKLIDIYKLFKSSKYYIILSKLEKRKYNKKYLTNLFSTNNELSKYYNERKKINKIPMNNMLMNYKIKQKKIEII